MRPADLAALERRRRIARFVQAVLAVIGGVLLHVGAFLFLSPPIVCVFAIVLGPVLAMVPFVVLSIIANADDDIAGRWLRVGLVCMPAVFALDLVLVIILLSMGYGRFHI